MTSATETYTLYKKTAPAYYWVLVKMVSVTTRYH